MSKLAPGLLASNLPTTLQRGNLNFKQTTIFLYKNIDILHLCLSLYYIFIQISYYSTTFQLVKKDKSYKPVYKQYHFFFVDK